MAYAQINYSQRLGEGPYSIADAGCFLTAFCNLMARFGNGVDPPTLNNYFVQHRTYVDVDDGHRDDLSWASIAAYDGRCTVVQIGVAGWPDNNDAIVKFVYKSKRTGLTTTHFCLVQDHNAHVIIDSWDGNTKVSPYGDPVAWAKYEMHLPQQVTPPPPPEQPAFTIQDVAEVTKELKIDTHCWDLNQRSWPAMVNSPVGIGNKGTKFQTSQIARHILGGSYYLPKGSTTQGYNVVDCQDPVAAPAPTPPPSTPIPAVSKEYKTNTVDGIEYTQFDGNPRVMYVTRQGGCSIWNFGNIQTWRDFHAAGHLDYGQQVYIVGQAVHPLPPNGVTYYMVDADFGDFRHTGKVINTCGINCGDLSETRPPKLPESMPVPAPEVKAAEAPTPPAQPVDWRDTYRPFSVPVDYITTRDLVVKDLATQQPDAALPAYNDDGHGHIVGLVKAYGTVTYQDVEYYRLRTNNDPKFAFWYCVPKFDPATRSANLLVKPTQPAAPVGKASIVRDTLELAKAHVEHKGLNFIDDMLPKWLKPNKNKK